MKLDPEVEALLTAPLEGERPPPPNHRALIADLYEPGLPEASLVDRQVEVLAASGQLPARAIFLPPDELLDKLFLGTGPGVDFKGIITVDEAYTWDDLPRIERAVEARIAAIIAPPSNFLTVTSA